MIILSMAVLAAFGASFGGAVTREGDHVRVIWTNVPPCSVIEWSADLSYWQAYSRLDCYACLTNYGQLSFSIKAAADREFWRLRDCHNE